MLPFHQSVIYVLRLKLIYSLPWHNFENDFRVVHSNDNDQLYLDAQGLSHLILITNLWNRYFIMSILQLRKLGLRPIR